MKTGRRDFFRKIGQFSCLSIIIGGTGYLISEKRISLEDCDAGELCGQCKKNATCLLEPAREHRRNPDPSLSAKNK